MVYSNKREEMNKDMVFQIFRLHLNNMGGQIVCTLSLVKSILYNTLLIRFILQKLRQGKRGALIGSTKVKTTESGNDCYFLK